jgi:hypothetical protein
MSNTMPTSNTCLVRPRLFYLLDYGFLPQNVSEVGKKQNKENTSPWPERTNHHRRPLLRFEDGIVSRAQFLFEWSHPYIDLMEGLNT